MSERFGGAYSPNSPEDEQINSFRGKRARRVSVWARMLYFAPIPLFFAGLGEVSAGNAFGAVLELGGFGLMMLAAWLLNEGLRAEEEYDARKVARPPAFPRKLFSIVLMAMGVAAANLSGSPENGLISAVAFGAIAAIAQTLAFGFDPMRKKGMEGINEAEADRVARAVDKAETTVTEMLDAARRIGDRDLQGRIERLAAAARDMFRTVEDDPQDLRRARKFMTVYLSGARDATVKFADLWSRQRDMTARVAYEDLLTDLEASFTIQKQKLLLENRTDLDVEIEVLRDRLQQEGISAR